MAAAIAIAGAMSHSFFYKGQIGAITWDEYYSAEQASLHGGVIIFLLFVYSLIFTFFVYKSNSALLFKLLNLLLLVSVIYITVLVYSDGCARFGIFDNHENPPEISHEAKDCFYFSVITFTTVGYGDFTPSPDLRLIAASEAFIGYLFLALLIACLTKVLSPTESTLNSRA
jgi:hypothetical protein